MNTGTINTAATTSEEITVQESSNTTAIGVAVGVVVAILGIILLVLLCICMKRKSGKHMEPINTRTDHVIYHYLRLLDKEQIKTKVCNNYFENYNIVKYH